MNLKYNWWKILLVLATLAAIVILQLPKEKTQAWKPIKNTEVSLDSPAPVVEPQPIVAPEETKPLAESPVIKPAEKVPSDVKKKLPTKKPAVKITPLPAPAPKPNIPPTVAATEKLPRLVEIGTASCGPCKLMRPLLTALRKDYAGRLQVEIIDATEQPEEKARYNVVSIPTIIFFDETGKELYRHFGFIPKAKILEKFTEYGVTFPEN